MTNLDPERGVARVLRDLTADYYTISGLASRALVELITADNDEQAETHARALVELTAGMNAAVDNLRQYAADPKVLGRDNFATFLRFEP